MNFLFSFLWIIRTTKIILFYLYLWQLKEYHIGRFLDHFRTGKGRGLILNKNNLIKVATLPLLLYLLSAEKQLGREGFLWFFIIVIILLYLIEAFFVFKNVYRRELKWPILTKKTIILLSAGLLIEILFLFIVSLKTRDLFFLVFWLLIFDILAPLLTSLIVLFFQPFTVLLRNQIIKKAKTKRAKYKDLLVIGITGSYGKTSTKEFLATMLFEKFKILRTREHQNSEVGISRCILDELKPEHEVFVVEMGAYGEGGIKLLSDIAKPKIGILTGINAQHMALFSSQGKIVKTKYELIESLPKDGLAIFNGDNKYCLDLYKTTGIPKKLYMIKRPAPETMIKADIWAEDIEVEKEFVSFKARTKDGETSSFEVKILGKQNISSILAAALVAKELGMSLEDISDACFKIRPEQGAMKILEGKNGLVILDTSYSANPDGVIADLNYLGTWSGRNVIVMPCLIELGKAAKKVHKRIGRKIAKTCDFALITTKEYFFEIEEGAREAGMRKENVIFTEDPEEIVRRIDILCVPGDVVLLEGRVPEAIIKGLKKQLFYKKRGAF